MQQKIWNQSQKNVGLKKAYFWGHPVIQAVEAEMLGPFNKKFIFLQISAEKLASTPPPYKYDLYDLFNDTYIHWYSVHVYRFALYTVYVCPVLRHLLTIIIAKM